MFADGSCACRYLDNNCLVYRGVGFDRCCTDESKAARNVTACSALWCKHDRVDPNPMPDRPRFGTHFLRLDRR